MLSDPFLIVDQFIIECPQSVRGESMDIVLFITVHESVVLEREGDGGKAGRIKSTADDQLEEEEAFERCILG